MGYAFLKTSIEEYPKTKEEYKVELESILENPATWLEIKKTEEIDRHTEFAEVLKDMPKGYDFAAKFGVSSPKELLELDKRRGEAQIQNYSQLSTDELYKLRKNEIEASLSESRDFFKTTSKKIKSSVILESVRNKIVTELEGKDRELFLNCINKTKLI